MGRLSDIAAGRSVERPPAKRFNLVSWFSVVGFVSIALISVAAAVLLSRFLEKALLERDTAIMQQLINNIVSASDSYSYFVEGNGGSTDLERFFARMAEMPDVVRAHAFAQDRTVIWSTETAFVGQRFDPNDELEEAFRGHPQVETGITSESTKLEHIALKTPGSGFVENYLPIWHHDTQGARVVGVVELYRAPENILNEIEAGKRLVWIGSTTAGLFLFATLFWLIRRANAVMLQQELQLIESETLSTLGEMASAVAHSLRNPLASIRSSAELALDSGPAPNVKAMLTDVVGQCDRLANWVGQYLVQIHSGAEEPENTVDSVIESCLDAFSAEFKHRNIRCASEVAGGLPAVAVNRLVLSQVLNGLIANAIEAMPDGGELTVTAQQFHSFVHIDIVDTGQSIPAEELEDLMRPFETTKRTGLGLGLPLAKRMIERHGGRLGLSSELGKGTTATLVLPVRIG